MTTEIDWVAITGHTQDEIDKMIHRAFEGIGLKVTLLSVVLASNAFSGEDVGFIARGSHPDGFDVSVGVDFVESGEIEVGIRVYSEKKDLWGDVSDFEGCGWTDVFNLIQKEMDTFRTSLLE